MRTRHIRTALFGTLFLVGLLMLFTGCESAGADGSTCDDTTTHTVEWKFSGSYSDSVSVATTWVNSEGSNATDYNNNAHVNPSNGTLLTETLPGCTGASINITTLEDDVTLTNVTLSIYVDGTLADSVSFNGTYPEGGTTLPSNGALTIVVGE